MIRFLIRLLVVLLANAIMRRKPFRHVIIRRQPSGLITYEIWPERQA